MEERAKRSGSEKRQRQHSLTVRFNAAEHAAVVAQAEAIGLSAASFARTQLLDVPPPRAARRPPVERAQVAQLLGHIGKVGSNINQIAKTLNTGKGSLAQRDLAEALGAVMDMREACLKALGRQP